MLRANVSPTKDKHCSSTKLRSPTSMEGNEGRMHMKEGRADIGGSGRTTAKHLKVLFEMVRGCPGYVSCPRMDMRVTLIS